MAHRGDLLEGDSAHDVFDGLFGLKGEVVDRQAAMGTAGRGSGG